MDTNFLRAARVKIANGEAHELYFNYFLMQLLENIHTTVEASITSRFAVIHSDVEALTGVVYSDLAVPVYLRGEAKVLAVEPEVMQQYEEYIEKNKKKIEAQESFINAFVLLQEMLRQLLSIYILSTMTEDKERVRIKTLQGVIELSKGIDIGTLRTPYLRKLYSLVIAIYNNFMWGRSTDYADYLYLLMGIDFEQFR